MTFIEQACQERAVALWRRRADYITLQSQFFVAVLRYSEAYCEHPTASAFVLASRQLSAWGAHAYRRHAPKVARRVDAVLAEPQLLPRTLAQFAEKAFDEARLQQRIVARLVKVNA
ncbi:hypothetical protein [Hyphomicrobium sp.]|uniref:hypothetical protein n=1 Tax=Hyphomicrobium sp. TaxID=82 RepID=UPI000F9B8017|nr:hypothetical protein [Hyphomicrobium sp.]RUO99210.1 MAG: hypothetical protein EKK30_08210 [Hyphomicrobium sp.]